MHPIAAAALLVAVIVTVSAEMWRPKAHVGAGRSRAAPASHPGHAGGGNVDRLPVDRILDYTVVFER